MLKDIVGLSSCSSDEWSLELIEQKAGHDTSVVAGRGASFAVSEIRREPI